MKHLSVTLIIFAISITSALAQIEITSVFVGPQFGFSFYEADKSKTEFGVFAGIEFNKRFVLGYEFYTTHNQKYEFKDVDVVYLSYHGPNIRYNFMTEKFRPYVSILFGFGDATPQYLKTGSDELNNPFILQPSLGADFDLHKRISAGLNIAFRNVSKGDFIPDQNTRKVAMSEFSAFMVTVRVGINLFTRRYE